MLAVRADCAIGVAPDPNSPDGVGGGGSARAAEALVAVSAGVAAAAGVAGWRSLMSPLPGVRRSLNCSPAPRCCMSISRSIVLEPVAFSVPCRVSRSPRSSRSGEAALSPVSGVVGAAWATPARANEATRMDRRTRCMGSAEGTTGRGIDSGTSARSDPISECPAAGSTCRSGPPELGRACKSDRQVVLYTMYIMLTTIRQADVGDASCRRNKRGLPITQAHPAKRLQLEPDNADG